jgi:hypothetical protein
LVGIIAKINNTECMVTEDHVLSYSFPDGKEYIFSLKANLAAFDAVGRRGQGLHLNLPDDLDFLKEAKEEHYRFYIFDPNQAIFESRFICFNQLDENMTQLMTERYEWLLKNFY